MFNEAFQYTIAARSASTTPKPLTEFGVKPILCANAASVVRIA
jgi:hypothetical protein